MLINTFELYWFLPFIILLGIITSYQDIKIGKIKNKWILYSILYVFLYYFILLILFLANKVKIENPNYLIEFVVMAFISLLIGFIIWNIGLWTAGDAKLFFAYSLLIPLSTYKYGYIPYLSSTNILFNTFVPLFIIISFMLLFKTNIKQKLFYLKKAFNLKQILPLLVFLFSFVWILNLFFSLINIKPDYFVSIVFLFLLLITLEKFLPMKLLTFCLIISILRIFFDNTALTFSSFKFLLIMWIVFIIIRFFILYLGFGFLTKDVDINLLEKGMIPAEKIYLSKGKYEKEQILYFSFINYMQEKIKKRKYLFENSASGLTEADVKKLKKLEKELGFEHLRVHQTLSFAPFMFAGVLLTIFFQGNLFIYLAPFFWSLF